MLLMICPLPLKEEKYWERGSKTRLYFWPTPSRPSRLSEIFWVRVINSPNHLHYNLYTALWVSPALGSSRDCRLVNPPPPTLRRKTLHNIGSSWINSCRGNLVMHMIVMVMVVVVMKVEGSRLDTSASAGRASLGLEWISEFTCFPRFLKDIISWSKK